MGTESRINKSHIFDSWAPSHFVKFSTSAPQSLPGTSLTLLCSKRPEKKNVVCHAFVHCFVIQSDELEMTKLQNASRKFNKLCLDKYAKGRHFPSWAFQTTFGSHLENMKNPQKLCSTVHPRTRWTCHCEVLRLLKIHTYLEGAKTWSLTEESMTR